MWTPPWTRGSNQLGKLIFDADPKSPEPYMIVYRLEDKDGIGVYQSGALVRIRPPPGKDAAWRREANRDHPTPYFDFLPEEWDKLPEAYKYLFAFLKPADAKKWFGPLHLKALEEQGITLVPRKARKVYLSESGRQVIFRPYRDWEKW